MRRPRSGTEASPPCTGFEKTTGAGLYDYDVSCSYLEVYNEVKLSHLHASHAKF